MSDDVPVVSALPDDLHTPAPDYFDVSEIDTFMGFRRADGRVRDTKFRLDRSYVNVRQPRGDTDLYDG